MTDALIIIDLQEGPFGGNSAKHDSAGLVGRLNTLAAEKIIDHHNAIWADFLAPAGPARVCPCAEVRLST